MRYGNEKSSALIPTLLGLLIVAILIGGGYYLYRYYKNKQDEEVAAYPPLPTITLTPRPETSPTLTPTPTPTATTTPAPVAKATGNTTDTGSNLPKSGPETDLPLLGAAASLLTATGYYLRVRRSVRSAYRDQAIEK